MSTADHVYLKRTKRELSGCLLWQGAVYKNGYGSAYVGGGKMGLAHRFAWETAYGPIPEGVCVCHKCDVRACVEPTHLFLGSKSDNSRDMWAKGRNYFQRPGSRPRGPEHAAAVYRGAHRGEDCYKAKLTEENVRDIRARAGDTPGVALAAEYGVTTATMSAVITRKTWRHVV